MDIVDVNGKLEKRWVYKRQDMVGANNGALVARRRAQFCKVVLSNTLTQTYTHLLEDVATHLVYTMRFKTMPHHYNHNRQYIAIHAN